MHYCCTCRLPELLPGAEQLVKTALGLQVELELSLEDRNELENLQERLAAVKEVLADAPGFAENNPTLRDVLYLSNVAQWRVMMGTLQKYHKLIMSSRLASFLKEEAFKPMLEVVRKYELADAGIRLRRAASEILSDTAGEG